MPKIVLVFLFCLNLVLAGCASATPTLTDLGTPKFSTTLAVAPNNSWQYHWLQKIPCAAPCWEGITPGVTTVNQALEILKKNSNIKLSEIDTPTPYSDNQQISWLWKDHDKGGVLFYPKILSSPIITTIAPTYPNSFRFGDVIQAYGEPSFVEATAAPLVGGVTGYTLSFLYLPHGFTIVAQLAENPTFNRDTLTILVNFFAPTTLEEYVKLTPQKKPGFVVAWEGFKDFAYYCRTNWSNIQNCTKI